MKKLIITAAMAGMTLLTHAQLAKVGTPQPLLQGVQSEMYNPVLSQDGTQLMFSDVDYTNPRVYDMTDNVTVKIQAAPASVMLAHPAAKTVATGAAAVRTEGSTLYIKKNGTERAYSPVECAAGYCWAQLSPDGTKVVFLAAGRGLVVCDMQGNVIARPGNYESPAWYGNNHLVVQNATSDGHNIASSQILLVALDGTAQALTKPESMTMTPTASAQAGLVVFSTIDGRLYKQTVTLNDK